MTSSAKLLIVKGCATVAEGRHTDTRVTQRNNKKPSSASLNDEPMEPRGSFLRVFKSSAEYQPSGLAGVVLLRHYIGASGSPIIQSPMPAAADRLAPLQQS